MKRFFLLSAVVVVVFGLVGCGDNGNSASSGLKKIYAEHAAPASKLLEGTWKLAGIVDAQTGSLQVLEPQNCENCYTLTFGTDNTFSSYSSANHSTGTYSYGTHGFINGHTGTELAERGDGNLWVSTLWAVESFSLLENELRLYYDSGRKYLKYELSSEPDDNSGLGKAPAHTAPEQSLWENTWKLTGIVDAKTGSLQVLEPKDCKNCYTLTFDTDSTFTSYSSANNGMGTYKYETHDFKITDHFGTEIGERGDGNLWTSTLWAVNSFSLLEDGLKLYYNENGNYLHFKSQSK